MLEDCIPSDAEADDDDAVDAEEPALAAVLVPGWDAPLLAWDAADEDREADEAPLPTTALLAALDVDAGVEEDPTEDAPVPSEDAPLPAQAGTQRLYRTSHTS